MKSVKCVYYNGNPVKIVFINHSPWFVASDLLGAIGYSNPRNLVYRYVDDTDQHFEAFEIDGHKKRMKIINEEGAMKIFASCRKEGIGTLKEWFVSELLPSLAEDSTQKTIDMPSDGFMCINQIADKFRNCSSKKINSLLLKKEVIRPVKYKNRDGIDYYELNLAYRNLGKVVAFKSYGAKCHQLKFNKKGVDRICKEMLKDGYRFKDVLVD